MVFPCVVLVHPECGGMQATLFSVLLEMTLFVPCGRISGMAPVPAA